MKSWILRIAKMLTICIYPNDRRIVNIVGIVTGHCREKLIHRKVFTDSI